MTEDQGTDLEARVRSLEQKFAEMDIQVDAIELSQQNKENLKALDRRVEVAVRGFQGFACVMAGALLIWFGQPFLNDANPLNDKVGEWLLIGGCGCIAYGLLVLTSNDGIVLSWLEKINPWKARIAASTLRSSSFKLALFCWAISIASTWVSTSVSFRSSDVILASKSVTWSSAIIAVFPTKVVGMLPAASVIDNVLSRYPPELREQVRRDLLELLKRDRSYLVSQIQMAAAKYCGPCTTLNQLRLEIDRILLTPADECDFLNSRLYRL
jgi:hypothetical protein